MGMSVDLEFVVTLVGKACNSCPSPAAFQVFRDRITFAFRGSWPCLQRTLLVSGKDTILSSFPLHRWQQNPTQQHPPFSHPGQPSGWPALALSPHWEGGQARELHRGQVHAALQDQGRGRCLRHRLWGELILLTDAQVPCLGSVWKSVKRRAMEKKCMLGLIFPSIKAQAAYSEGILGENLSSELGKMPRK